MLGIGGKELSEENAAQTAKALNIIQPDFIRVHATGIKLESKLGEFVRDGSFTLQSEEEIVIEQKLFLQQLHEMDSYYVNEHIVNLLLEVRGNLRTEKQEMLSTIDRFLTLPPDERAFVYCRQAAQYLLPLGRSEKAEAASKGRGKPATDFK